MRKNKSVKDQSFGKGRRSQGKEISIDLDPSLRTLQQSHRYDKQLTDRSLNQISQNILKDIINYSHLSQSQTKVGKGSTTLASYEKHQDVMSQFNKLKKTSLGDISRKQNQKLTLDQPSSSQVSMKSVQLINESKSLQMLSNELFGSGPVADLEAAKNEHSSKKHSLASSISKSQLAPLEKEKVELMAKLDDLQLIEDAFINQCSQMALEWSQMVQIQIKSQKETKRLTELQKRREIIRNQIDSSNDMLLTISREFVDSRRKWDERGNGGRTKVLDQAMFSHQDFLRKLTVRDFEETVLFNMKVTIPDHKSKTSVRGIYEDLFHSKSAKKFTMILKKHSSHMDLYDGKLLSQFTKRINDLEGQYSRCEGESLPHNDEPYLQKIQLAVTNIDQLKFTLESIEGQKKRVMEELSQKRQQERQCKDKIETLIQEMNGKVKGEYERETQKAADFKTLLTERYSAKYQEFKKVKIEKQRISREVERLQEEIESLFAY